MMNTYRARAFDFAASILHITINNIRAVFNYLDPEKALPSTSEALAPATWPFCREPENPIVSVVSKHERSNIK